jgi:alanyl-tRNA synthetase/REP element-mobilizing transposase RayT
MTSAQIRQSFLDFFKSKQHTIVPSSSLMPDSPNLLFTNAGMNQFVPIFLGQKKADVSKWAGAIPGLDTRAADTQKVIRAGGKHNDLEDVGLDTYHHTFFEMLGNWSFGDYFKREAIDWAWELVTGVWKFPKERLYATVYKPVQGDPSELDQEAWDIWAEKFRAAGLDPQTHIVFGDKKDNFWMMGDTGPCGPCSEIHMDLTPEGDTRGSLVNKGDARCIEIWNLVFIQFNANPDGTFSPLPARHVDTGMGFERVTSIIQCTRNFTDFTCTISNYETDIFRPIFDELEQMSGKRYSSTLPGEHTRPRVSQSAPPPIAPGEAPGTSEVKYSRRHLPHFERPWAKYIVTFSTRERRQLTPAERDLVLKSILYARERRQIELYAACVMPDHVHLLFEPQIKDQDEGGNPVFWSLSEILQGIKSASAHNINEASVQKGPVWEKESMDRMIRGQSDMEEKFQYICRNPWDAGAVPGTESYPWLWVPDVPESRRASPAAVGAPPTASSTRSDAVGEGADCNTRGSVCSPPTAAAQAAAPLLPASEQEKTDIAFRVIADHIRTLSFAIADGIQPGNTDRNYVLRRILRRAVRYGRTLGFHEPFFYKLVDVLADTMGDVFPEIRAKQKHIEEVIRVEEEAFNKTLDRGIEQFEFLLWQTIRSHATSFPGAEKARVSFTYKGSHVATNAHLSVPEVKLDLSNEVGATLNGAGIPAPTFPGAAAFELYDTYGFPLDLTELMARERGLTVDKEGFEKLMEEQRARARAAQKKTVISVTETVNVHTKFVGYDTLEADCHVLNTFAEMEREGGDNLFAVVDVSPLYAEMGGQVGDTGMLTFEGQAQGLRIVNTLKRGQAFFLKLESTDEEPWLRSEAPKVHLRVDAARRYAIQRHHTVTHLLHWALHEVVSREASQKGSFVGPDKLTFDFNSAPLTLAQLADIEKLVNERILENAGVSWTEIPYADVKSRKDVLQFFGDKYGDIVRVVQIGGQAKHLDGYSMELCGGTHTRATGEIGLFRIVSENAIAAGVRRIEAVAGLQAYDMANQQLRLLRSVAGQLNSPVADLEKKMEALLTHQKELEKQIKASQQREALSIAANLKSHAVTINGIPAIIYNLGTADGDLLQAVADALKSTFKGAIVLGGVSNGAVALVSAVTPEFTARVQAGKIIQQIAPIVSGKGGGKPDNARGGGKDPSQLAEALVKARTLLG